MNSRRIDFARRMAAGDQALRLYAILDAESCAHRGLDLFVVAEAWRVAGVALIQYRDKSGSKAAVAANAKRLRELLPEAFLLLNDHVDLVADAGFDGAHVGQGDTPVSDARRQLGDDAILGVSTHSADQALAAEATECDYIAIGPVFATTTKQNPEPTVGICGVQAARAVTRKPLVAIGGIGLRRAREVRLAGADSVALISALLTGELPETAMQFRTALG